MTQTGECVIGLFKRKFDCIAQTDKKALHEILCIIKGVNLQIVIVVGADNGNINFRLPS